MCAVLLAVIEVRQLWVDTGCLRASLAEDRPQCILALQSSYFLVSITRPTYGNMDMLITSRSLSRLLTGCPGYCSCLKKPLILLINDLYVD